MNMVSEAVRSIVAEVVFKIVYVQVAMAETLAWSKMEVAYDFVDSYIAFYATSFLSLSIELLSVMFTRTLFNSFTTSKRP